MPLRIAYYQCRYCERKWGTHDEADLCEQNCGKETACTMCGWEGSPDDLEFRKDASGFQHRLCPECFQDLLSFPSKPTSREGRR